MAEVYEAAHRRDCCAAITAKGNRVGLFAGATRVGTVYADTVWAAPVDATVLDPVTNKNVQVARSTGSTVTITIPGGTVPNETVINGYGIFNGNTLLRRNDLPISLTIHNAAVESQVDVNPIFQFRGSGEVGT